MFFKLKHASKKTGLATVYVLYRYEGKETAKTTGVNLKPAHYLGDCKVSKQDKDNASKSRKIYDTRRLLELAAEAVARNGGKPTCEAVSLFYEQMKEENKGNEQEEKDYLDSELSDMEKLELEVIELEKVLAEKKELLINYKQIFEAGYADNSKVLLADKVLEYVKLDNKNYRLNTLQGYKNLAVLIKAFRPKLGITEVNLEVLGDFKLFLNKKGMRNRSVIETVKRLKVIVKFFAKEYGMSTDFLSELTMLKVKQNDNIIYLTEEELEEFELVELESANQRQIQKQFLFCCYTGLRISDIHITKGNIHPMPIGEDGIQRNELRVAMTKTGSTVFIPLSPKAEAIINSAEFPFKNIFLNHYNKGLKLICKKLPSLQKEITLTHFVANNPVAITKPKWELVSSHTGRKTAINTWLNKGVSETVVGEWAGHVDTQMLRKHYQDKRATAQRES
ncbi:MAG: phage integrase SAM-like domain-containing protein, partial [Janthinobacterium lividum]